MQSYLQLRSSELVFYTWYFTLGAGGVGKICERNGEGSTRKGGKLELLGWESCQVKCLLLYSHDHVIKAIRALLMVLWFVDPGLDSTLYEPGDPVRHATNPFESNPAYPSYSLACELIHRQLAPHSQAPDLADLLRPLQFL